MRMPGSFNFASICDKYAAGQFRLRASSEAEIAESFDDLDKAIIAQIAYCAPCDSNFINPAGILILIFEYRY